jgi:hypothetical protein
LSARWTFHTVAERITAEVVRKRLQLALVVVDTAAAYNFAEDENSNTQAERKPRNPDVQFSAESRPHMAVRKTQPGRPDPHTCADRCAAVQDF